MILARNAFSMGSENAVPWQVDTSPIFFILYFFVGGGGCFGSGIKKGVTLLSICSSQRLLSIFNAFSMGGVNIVKGGRVGIMCRSLDLIRYPVPKKLEKTNGTM